MAKLNSNYKKLGAGYLFPEIAKRTKQFLEKNPDAKVMRLGIGDTTEPLSKIVVEKLKFAVEKLGNRETYSGYGAEQGNKNLRDAIVQRYNKLGIELESSEVFISDGAKPDSANIQSIFSKSLIAVQDPAYPVYVDSNVIGGNTGSFNKSSGQYEGIVYMPCDNSNDFFPDLPSEKVDLIYLCSPNNPTGAVATKEQLKKFVDYAIENKAVIIFDTAYATFISDEKYPKSIYEIEGAKKCSIEINSFSKEAGFTGVRLGWSIVPEELVIEDTKEGEINAIWNRRQCTMFNGASNIVQEGGLAVLSEEGQAECHKIISYYMENAKIIKNGLEDIGIEVFGGVNAPYVWMKTPNNLSSWEFFDLLLNKAHVVGTPGSGFGPSGEGFFRLSAFGHREDIVKAVKSIKENLEL